MAAEAIAEAAAPIVADDEAPLEFTSIDDLQTMVRPLPLYVFECPNSFTPSPLNFPHFFALQGINVSDISKLKGAGIHTVGQLMSTPSKVRARDVVMPRPLVRSPRSPNPLLPFPSTKTVLAIKGLSEAKLEKLQEAAKKIQPSGFLSGAEVLRSNIATKIFITTGSKDLDAILGGGLETGSVTEVFGEFRCGKTQLAATLAVNCQLERASGGASGKVLILDTNGDFRVERVAEIAEKRYGLDPGAVLENVSFARCNNHEHQMELAVEAAALITGSSERYRLLIVDSVIGLFRTEFSGRGELADRQQKLGGHIRALVKLAQEFNIAVL